MMAEWKEYRKEWTAAVGMESSFDITISENNMGVRTGWMDGKGDFDFEDARDEDEVDECGVVDDGDEYACFYYSDHD